MYIMFHTLLFQERDILYWTSLEARFTTMRGETYVPNYIEIVANKGTDFAISTAFMDFLNTT